MYYLNETLTFKFIKATSAFSAYSAVENLQINLAEELGSGFKKLAKYVKAYFGVDPVIEEKDIFKFTASLKVQPESGVESEMALNILCFIEKVNLSKKDIAVKFGKSKTTRYLNELIARYGCKQLYRIHYS